MEDLKETLFWSVSPLLQLTGSDHVLTKIIDLFKKKMWIFDHFSLMDLRAQKELEAKIADLF